MINLNKTLVTIKKLINYLNENGVECDEKGWPIFKKEWFLTEIPDKVVPYNHRNDIRIVDKTKTIICHYCADKYIYPRISKVLKDIPEYKKFMGVIQSDVTITSNMDIELQETIMLLNSLYIAVLGVNGVKIVANTRCGNIITQNNLKCFPKGIIWASGFLGCAKSRNATEAYEYIQKIINIQPSCLLIYGKHDKFVEELLDNSNIKHKHYIDFHQWERR